jgi:hypothetical protein
LLVPAGVSNLLNWRTAILPDVLAARELRPHILNLLSLMIAGAAAYGAVLGMWHGPRLALYCAIKFPLVLLLTTGITIAFSWLAATLLGLPLTAGQVIALNLLALGAAATLLASLVPIAWLFTYSAPPPTAAERTTHNLLYLMHTGFVAGCGLAGMRLLWIALERTGKPRHVVVAVLLVWIVTYALVGGEVAWALRPFVGSVSRDYPVVFLRPDALHGNVYEFILTDILPHLAGSTSK